MHFIARIHKLKNKITFQSMFQKKSSSKFEKKILTIYNRTNNFFFNIIINFNKNVKEKKNNIII